MVRRIKMPNWCDNTLTISGTKEDLEEFKNKAKTDKEVLSLNNFVPMPKELDIDSGSFSGDKKTEMEKIYKENEKKYGYKSWYEWCVENWGTKWEVMDADILNEEDDYIDYRFDTAWSPPTEWLQKVAKQNPNLNFKLVYREDGMGFMGADYYEGGELVNNVMIDDSYDTIAQQLTSEGLDPKSDEWDERESAMLDELELGL
jgi:hypothetical protein